MRPKLLPTLTGTFSRTITNYNNFVNPKYVNNAESGEENFKKDFEKSHIQTNPFQKILLGIGSGVISITSPSRGDMIAVMGEVTGYEALDYIQFKMLQSQEGRRILEEKPRISSSAVDLEKLKRYPDGTLGKAYSNFLERYGYTPDTRNSVRFVDNIEQAYVAQRYREAHDLFHTLLNMPTNMLGEVTVKWVEAIQTRLPMCVTGALFGAVRLAPKFTRSYSTKPVVKLDQILREKIENEKILPNQHPGVMCVNCQQLPEMIKKNIKEVAKEYNVQELMKNAKEISNFVRSRLLPVEKDIKNKKREYFQQQLMQKNPGKYESEFDKIQLEKKVTRLLTRALYNWRPIVFDKFTSISYLVGRAPAEYAVLQRVFNEIIKRDSGFSPKNLFDFGSGVGTVCWAAHQLWGNTLTEYYCVDTSSEMNELAAMVIRENSNKTNPFIQNVYYREFLPSSATPFDIVVSSFSFFELHNCEERLKVLTNLWNKTKNYLVLIEVGSNAGFHIIAEARDFILQISQKYNLKCHVFAPCPHDLFCPRYKEIDKITPCNFPVKFNILNLNNKNDESQSERFSYLILKKGPQPPENERHSRIVREVVKRHKHVVCRLCTNKGELVEIFPSAAKYGKTTYNVLRKSNWGDLVPGSLEYSEEEKKSSELYSGSDSDSDSDDSSSSSDDNESENKDKKQTS